MAAIDRSGARANPGAVDAGVTLPYWLVSSVLGSHQAALAGRGSSICRPRVTQTRALPLLALVGVTAIWGLTFVQVQDALALYPLFAFLAVRFAISTAVLAPFAWGQVRALAARGLLAGVGAGALLAAAYGFQTAGLELTTVSSTGFITGLYVVFTPFIALGCSGHRCLASSGSGSRARSRACCS